MIKRLKVIGYKSLKDAEVFFEPLSVILGPNAAGKSNLLDALNLLSRIATNRNLKEAFENQRGLPLESFYYGEAGYEKLLEKDTAEIHFEVDVELSPYITNTVEKIDCGKAEEYGFRGKTKKRKTERYLRYALTILILPKTGHLRVLDESLRALKKMAGKKQEHHFLKKFQFQMRSDCTFVWRGKLIPRIMI